MILLKKKKKKKKNNVLPVFAHPVKIKGTWNFQAPKSFLFKTQSLCMMDRLKFKRLFTFESNNWSLKLTLNLIGCGMSHDQMSHMSRPLRFVSSYFEQSLYACADQCFGLMWIWIKASIMICSLCKVSLQKTYNTAVESYEFISRYLHIPLELQSPGAGFMKKIFLFCHFKIKWGIFVSSKHFLKKGKPKKTVLKNLQLVLNPQREDIMNRKILWI